MKKVLLVFLIVGLLIATTACKRSNITSIADVEKTENIGKTFTVQGVVQTTLQTGRVSGYKIKDSTGTIDVSTKNIPEKNTTVTVTGTLDQSTFFGYYITPNEKTQ
jgi:hypothetical protein